MTRDEVKNEVDELMRQYDDEEIDGKTYSRKIMELSARAKEENQDD